MKKLISFKPNFKTTAFIVGLLFAFIANAQQANFSKRYTAIAKTPTNLKTAATICPVSPVILQGQHATGNALNSGVNLGCNLAPFSITPETGTAGMNEPCIGTTFTNFSQSLYNNGSLHIFEGSTPYDSLCPTCPGQIGVLPGSNIFNPPDTATGQPWGLIEYELYPTKPHNYAFCAFGSIITNTISFQDCWTGSALPFTPVADSIFSNTNANPCFTVTIPANTDIGTASYAIAPASASVALTDLTNGIANVDPSTLPPGTYTVTYSFMPSVSSHCGTVTGTFKFTTTASPTVTVNSPTLCPGSTATLTAHGANNYTWSAGLSGTTGANVTGTPTVTTTYTVTGKTGQCTSAPVTATITVISAPTFTVNKGVICAGSGTTLIASNSALTYSWIPSAASLTVSATTDSAFVNPSASTAYTITGANAACPAASLTITDSVIVKQSPSITVLSPTVCTGTTATITATGASTYTWSPLASITTTTVNSLVFVQNPTVNATYTVYGTAPNGCVDSAVSNVVVSNYLGIVPYPSSPINICYGLPLNIGAVGAGTYTWTTLNGSSDSLDFGLDTSAYVNASIALPGTYSVEIYGESAYSGPFCSGTNTIVVIVNPTPTITAVSPTNTTICAGSSTTLSAVAAGAVNINYYWSPSTGLSTPTPTGNVATVSPTVTTVYNILGTNNANAPSYQQCSSSASFTVNAIPIPSFTVNSATICLNSSDSLKITPTTTLSGAQAYSWTAAAGLHPNNANGNALANPTTIGVNTYTVVGTNSLNGISCPSTQTSTVVVLPPPTVSVTPTPSVICSGATTTLTAAGSSDVISYAWSAGATATSTNVATASPIVNTIYTVTATSSNGACTANAVASVTVNPLPNFSIINSNPTYCVGDSTHLSVVPASGSVTATYSWTPATGLSSTTNTLVTSTATNTLTIYTVNAVSGDGCLANSTTTVTVNQLPNITFTPFSAAICNGDSTVLTPLPATGVTYTWSPNNTIHIITTGASTVVNAIPTTNTAYTLTGTDGNGCINSYVATVSVNPTPDATANINGSTCVGHTINLTSAISNTVTGALSYSWTSSNGYTSNAQNPLVTNNATSANNGTYTVTIKDANGGCATSAVVAVTVYTSPTISVSALPTGSVCPNSLVNFTATSPSDPLNYTWSPSGTSGSTFTGSGSSTTVYTVSGTDANGCSAVKTTTLNVYQVVAAIVADPSTGDAPLTVNLANNSTGATTYTWNYGNGVAQVVSNTSAGVQTNYLNQGTYTVTLMAANAANCKDSTTTQIIVTENYAISIPNIFTPNGDGINDNFFVKSTGVTSMNIIIVDRWGLKMWESDSAAGMWDGKNGSKEVTDGTYFYIIKATSTKGETTDYKGTITVMK